MLEAGLTDFWRKPRSRNSLRGIRNFVFFCAVNNARFHWNKTESRLWAGQQAQKLGKDRVWFRGYARGQTAKHTHTQTDTQTCSLQYFATARAGEVKTLNNSLTLPQLQR